MKIYGVMKDYSHKIRSKICRAYRVNRLKKWAEIWHVVGVTIRAVPQSYEQNPTFVKIT